MSEATLVLDEVEVVPRPVGSPVPSRDEMNLAEFPLAVLSTRVSSETKTLEFSDTIKLKSGEIMERNWTITGTDKFGLPTSTDDDVLLGLINLTMEQGFRDRKVFFTRYELMKILRWNPEGRNYTRIERSLDRLSGVRIKTNAFFDNGAKTFQIRNFGIIDDYKFAKARKNGAGDEPKSFFVWSEVLFSSFKAGFVKKLDLDLYFTLKSAVSRRLYRFLDKHFYYKPVIEKPLMVLALEKLGLSRSYRYVSSIKQQIEPAADELKAMGFISQYEFSGRGEGTTIRFYSAKARPQQPAIAAPATAPAGGSDLLQELLKRGMSEKQAARLLGSRTPEELKQIPRVLSYYDKLMSEGASSTLRNAIGFLYRAVESPFKFVPAAAEQAPRRRPMPPLKAARSAGDENARSAYQRYCDDQVARHRAQMSADDLQRTQFEVERQLSRLRSVLTKERFQEAVNACIRDAILREKAIPSFEVWRLKAL